MLNLSKHWLQQLSFDNLYEFSEINDSPLVNNFLYDRVKCFHIHINNINKLLDKETILEIKLEISIRYNLLNILKILTKHYKKKYKQNFNHSSNDCFYHDNLITTIRFNYLDMVKYLVSPDCNIIVDIDYALIMAARYGHLEIVKYLVSRGANINAYNDNILEQLRERNHIEVIKYLQSLSLI